MKTFLKDLRESNEFLNLLLENMDQAVLIVDETFRIFQVNNYFYEMFDKASESVVNQKFGGVSGCVHSVLENKPCGEASACKDCILQATVIKTLAEKVPADRIPLNRKFYINNQPVDKFMQFSTRYISFQGKKMILVLIYDITEVQQQRIELERKQAQIESDLAMAAEIQKSLLPQAAPPSENVRVAWKFEPSGKIGGDIFNICRFDRNRIGLYMLDVCGHGVAAALIAVTVSQFLSSRRTLLLDSSEFESPQTVLNSLNHVFPFERFDSFFTILHMTIDSRTGMLTYGNAGHPPPVIVRADDGLEVLEENGPVIGADSAFFYEEAGKRLEPGDKIVLFTDGILEVCNKDGNFYGKDRLLALLRENARMSPEELVETVYSAAKGFCGDIEIDDDISLLIAEYRG